MEIVFRLRQPLLKPDVSSITEKWLFLSDSQVSSPATSASVSNVTSPATKPSPTVVKSPSVGINESVVSPPPKPALSNVAKSTSKPDLAVSTTAAQAAVPAASEDIDDLKLQFDK